MSKRRSVAAPNPSPPPPPSPTQPDPAEILSAHLAEQTGLTRKEAADKLIQLGHCVLRENRAGIFAITQEINQLSAAKHTAEQAKAGGR